jgi:hypothetical protein
MLINSGLSQSPSQEASLGGNAELDFTSLLDELLAASEEADALEAAEGPAPSLQVDMLAQIERLQAENVGLFADRGFKAYGDSMLGGTAHGGRGPSAEPNLEPALEDLFFLDPESISRELGIKSKSKPEELDRARRTFAMRYHPDRVPEEFRDRAALRMQIANMLIDEAKKRKAR